MSSGLFCKRLLGDSLKPGHDEHIPTRLKDVSEYSRQPFHLDSISDYDVEITAGGRDEVAKLRKPTATADVTKHSQSAIAEIVKVDSIVLGPSELEGHAGKDAAVIGHQRDR